MNEHKSEFHNLIEKLQVEKPSALEPNRHFTNHLRNRLLAEYDKKSGWELARLTSTATAFAILALVILGGWYIASSQQPSMIAGEAVQTTRVAETAESTNQLKVIHSILHVSQVMDENYAWNATIEHWQTADGQYSRTLITDPTGKLLHFAQSDGRHVWQSVSINAITSPNRRVLDFNQQDLESFTANSDQRDPFYGEIGWDGRLVKTLISIDGNCQSQQCVIEALDEPPALGIDSGAYAAGQYSSGGSLVGTESINGRSAEIFHISYKESDNVDHDALSQYRIAKVDADTFAVLGIADYDGDQVRQSIDLMSQEQVTMSAQDFQEISADALAVMAPEPREAILFENSLQIAGYVLLPESSNQDNLFFTVFWQSEEAVTDDNYRGIIHVQDENGTLVTEVSAPLRWQTDNGNVKAQITFRDVHQWPNGRYQIYAGIYDQEVGQNLLSDSGEEMILVDTIVLEESAVPANDMAENQIPFGDNIALTHDHYIQGATVEREEVHILRFLWEARQTQTENLTAFVHLLNENGQVVQQQDQELIWTIATGQMVKPGFTEYALQSVEVDLPDGRYQVQVGVYDPATGQRLITADGGTVLQIDELVIENKPTN